jgi:ATP-binding cassette subfamily B multidrug efflux pump
MIRRLSKCIREYKYFVLLSPLCVIAESFLAILIPYKMSSLIDFGVDAGDMEFVKRQGLILIGYAALSMLFGVIGAWTASVGSAGFAKNLRHDMFHNIQRFSFSNIDKFSSAGLVTRMTTDVTQVQQAFMMINRGAFRAPCILIFALVAAFRINRKLPIVFTLAIPFMVLGITVLIKVCTPLFTKLFKTFDRLNAVVQENVRGIRVVKAFVRENREKEKFSEVAGEVYNISVKTARIMALLSPIMEMTIYAVTLLVCWIGARLVVSREMTTGQLMSTFSYISRILMALLHLAMLIMHTAISAAAAKRIMEVLDEEPEIKSPETAKMSVEDGSVEFKNVSFAYSGGGDCIKDISFKIKSGDTVGIIGGTGSGKSSLVQLIPRLYDAKTGEVLVGGVNVKEMDIRVLRSNVAMVLQKNILFEGTLEDNLRWGKEDADEDEMNAALELAQAGDFVSAMEGGLKAHIEQGGSNVSGGQRQRLCIARALLSNPKIIIFDDSTSAVDTATEAKIREGLKDSMPDVTKIIIAQRILSVQGADEIMVLDDGVLSGIGTHEELLETNKIYKEVYESQTKGGDFDEPAAE